MNSLKRYLTDGAEILFITFISALIISFAITLFRSRKNKTALSKKCFFVLWYALALEGVSFWYNVDSMHRFRALNLHLFLWIEDFVITGPVCLWQIVLNFCLYIPLGFILAMLYKKPARLKLPLIIAGVSLLNELLQYAFAMGSTDIDDLAANTLGGVWGIALYYLAVKLREKKKPDIKLGLSVAAPFIAVAAVAVCYIIKPLGYIEADFNTKGISVHSVYLSSVNEEDFQSEAGVYIAPHYNMKALEKRTAQIFSGFGETENEKRRDKYDNLLVSYGTNPSYYTWCWDDGRFMFVTMEHGIEMNYPDEPMIDRVRLIIKDCGLELPEEFCHDDLQIEFDEYTINYRFVPYKDHIYAGELMWVADDDTLYELKSDVMVLNSANKTQKLAFETFCENLQNGNFRCAGLQGKEVRSLSCEDCRLEYELDTKGYYRPLYRLHCLADGEEVIVQMALH